MLNHQKHLFNIPKDITYFNIASISPSFKSIEEAGIKAVLQKSHPYLISNSDFFDPVIELKKLFAQLIEVDDYNRIASIPSVSYGLATVANNLKLKESDEILVIGEQFPSNVYVWQKLAEKYNATIKTICSPQSKNNSGQQWNADILNAINDNTAVVAMGNIHWANGTLFNLKAIRKKTKLHNTLLIIDGSQSVGALPFSVKELQPDALICAGYKWLFGPYGCGYAYYGSFFDNGNPIEENWVNRFDSENFANLTSYQSKYKPLSNRYSVGESGSFIYVKMQIEALKQIIDWTPQAIQNYCMKITSDATQKLQDLGCHIENSKYRAHHLFGVKLPENTDIELLKSEFKKHNVFVSFRGKYIRISCHLYNTAEDFTPLINCIKTAII